MNEEKKFVVPTAEIVDFENQDIITNSLAYGGSDPGFGVGEDW